MEECLNILENCGFNFKSFTLDGKRGFLRYLALNYTNIPIQFCQFHQLQIIRRYNTRSPRTACGQELNKLMSLLTALDRSKFIDLFNNLKNKYREFLKEKNEKGEFIHRKIRSAIRSLNTNIPYLFTYKDYPELNIPNTTNSCEGSFSHLKNKAGLHRGISRERLIKMVNYFLENS